MNTLSELFELDISAIIVGILIIMASINAAFEIIGKFSSVIGKPVSWIKNKNKDHQLLLQTANDLNTLKENYEESVKQSIIHDNRIKNDLSDLADKVDALADSITEMKDIQDADKLSEYKDRIGQSYRYYCERQYSESNPVPYWNHMEKEALKGLIEQYEAHGGKNSFVHSVVEPEMQKWKVID